ncbi:uncharacterized protein LOC128743691 [Sabethes cyaneus]|uniref:uncharacterized protein LOC128743691 n=1 Tax=Sabethes cyaneus TaxID=53552 RepID=UPI00237E60E6|nr:uncharacterized protein LOC128743691 [Sabethes cyaneus]
MDKRKLSCGDIIHILELYRENECLWKQSRADYKDKQKRLEALARIKKATNMTSIDEVRRRIKNIRDTYCHERRKSKRAQKSTKLPWYQMAEFLTERGAKPANDNSVDASCSKQDDDPEDLEYSSIDIPDSLEQDPQVSTDVPHNEEVFENAIIAWSSVDNNPAETDTKKEIDFTCSSVNPTTKKLNRSVPSHITSASNRVEHMRPPISQSTEDEFHHFGLNLAAQLRQLPILRALKLQEKLQSLVSKERINFETDQQHQQRGES